MTAIVLIFLFILGACFGSFLCCQARRLHLRESNNPPKPLKSTQTLPPRSICLHCKTKLKWYDNLPLISWLILKGKCRKCGKKIGLAELLSELGLGLAFILPAIGAITSGVTLNIFLAQPIIVYVAIGALGILVVSLGFLAIYDGLYGELPAPILTFSAICAIIISCLKIISSAPFSWDQIINPALAVLLLSGFYLALHLVSKGKWVGDGDWLLCLPISLVLGTPWLALIVLFLSNFLACLVMLPATKGKNLKIPFGPFLVAAFIITLSFSSQLTSVL